MISGPTVDGEYYEEVKLWKMENEVVDVVDENDHLGQIISGTNQVEKNINYRITQGRKSLFSLLGAGFTFKSNLSPTLMLHLYRTFTCPIIRSGLSTFALRPSQSESLSLFSKKVFEVCHETE